MAKWTDFEVAIVIILRSQQCSSPEIIEKLHQWIPGKKPRTPGGVRAKIKAILDLWDLVDSPSSIDAISCWLCTLRLDQKQHAFCWALLFRHAKPERTLLTSPSHDYTNLYGDASYMSSFDGSASSGNNYPFTTGLDGSFSQNGVGDQVSFGEHYYNGGLNSAQI
ncbi:hypothetical protein BU26DRAFT_512323 [Trematosphaeria pertusa]|uniref:Uncharacterized protein n=1 Tax=Trematosphaeria pertusa TaxID=390896 RepID=A0A6A6HR45_9PLEO|nr:uncharacterized protein BU26DRAFT_512323 [Trematosphaeria pertusa]KAF2240349.1 hypothetical protein BU26DRAFT_512323 [Trematosphaeria pertusa]